MNMVCFVIVWAVSVLCLIIVYSCIAINRRE